MSTNMSADVPVYKRALRRCTQQLIEELHFDSITDYLISREAFPSVQLRDIKISQELLDRILKLGTNISKVLIISAQHLLVLESSNSVYMLRTIKCIAVNKTKVEERYTSERIRALLEKIENTGLEAYKIFLDGLVDKSVQQKHLRKLLLDEEKKIKQENENEGEKKAVKSATLSAKNTEPEVLYNLNLNNNKFNTSQQNKDIPTQNTSQTVFQIMPEPCKKGKNVTDSIEPENYQSSGQKSSDMLEAGRNVTDCHTDKHTDDGENQFEEQALGGAGLEPLPSLVGNLSSYQDMHENSNIETGPGFTKEKQQGLNTDPQRATEGCNVPDRETLIPRTEGKEPISDMDRDQETRPDNPKSEDVSLKLNIKGVNGKAVHQPSIPPIINQGGNSALNFYGGNNTIGPVSITAVNPSSYTPDLPQGKFPQPTLPIGNKKTDGDDVSDDEEVSTMTSDMSALSTKDEHKYLSEHFDACVIATEKNRNRAEEIIKFVGNLRGGYKICYYDDEEHFGLFDSTTHPEVIFKHCFLHLIIISDDLDNKGFAKYIRRTVAMIGKNTARCRTVLFTKEEEKYKKGYMEKMKDIHWYDMDKDYRKTDLMKLLERCKKYRKEQEEKESKTPFDTTP